MREIYEIVPARRWKGEEKEGNKIVFIGTPKRTTLFRSEVISENELKLLFSTFIYLYFIAGHNLNEDVLSDSFSTCAT